MGIAEIIRGILSQSKKIETSNLPTQGLFYKPDFEIRIKKAEMEDIIDYEFNYDKENLYAVIESVKNVVKKNIQFSKNYKFEDSFINLLSKNNLGVILSVIYVKSRTRFLFMSHEFCFRSPAGSYQNGVPLYAHVLKSS